MSVIRYLLVVYLVILVARWIMDLVMMFSRGFRPTGLIAALFEFVFTMTDPPLKFLRRVIPSPRVGNVAVDLSFLVLVIVIQILIRQLPR